MVLEGLRAYLQLANGLSEVTRERARTAARTLVAQGEASVGAVVPEPMRAQVNSLSEDLIATSKANRDLLVGLVRAEVERSVHRLGLVSAVQLEAATKRAQSLDDRVHELERALRAAQSQPAAQTGAPAAAAKKSAAKKSAAKKSAAKKSAAKKSPAKKTVETTAARRTTTNTAAARRAPGATRRTQG